MQRHRLCEGPWQWRPRPRPRRDGSRQAVPLAILLVCGLGLSNLVTPTGWAAALSQEPGRRAATAATPAAQRHPREKTYIKRKWGVEILFVRQTAARHMLEFRYKVLDPDKARALFVRKNKPLLTDVKSGAQLVVPVPAKTGALRNSDVPLAGHNYWMFFANPGNSVKTGDRVDIQIGEFLAQGLVVQ